LGRWGSDQQRSTQLQAYLSGETTAAWALGEPAPGDGLGTITLQASSEGSSIVLSGSKGPVEAAAEASEVLVVAREGEGLSQFLVPLDHPGLKVTPLQGVGAENAIHRLRPAL